MHLSLNENTTVTDTCADAERVLIDVYRRMSPAEKWRQLGALYRCGRILAEAGARRQNPTASADDIRRDWMSRTAALSLAAAITGAHGPAR
jgi:hypothetical protein